MIEIKDLAQQLKEIGVQSLVIDTSTDSTNYPYSGRQMVVMPNRLCQHIELRAKTLHEFMETAHRFWSSAI